MRHPAGFSPSNEGATADIRLAQNFTEARQENRGVFVV